MEFASELVVKASLADGGSRKSRLRSIRTAAGGRRICRAGATAGGIFGFCCSSARAGCFSIRASIARLGHRLDHGAVFHAGALSGAGLDIHSMLYASAAALLGMQLCLFALFARVSAQNAGLLPRRRSLDRLLRTLTLERGLLLGLSVAVCGCSGAARLSGSGAKPALAHWIPGS